MYPVPGIGMTFPNSKFSNWGLKHRQRPWFGEAFIPIDPL